MMYKHFFHILFEAILKILILGVLFFSMAYLVFIVTADAKPIRGHKHYRHALKIHKKNKILNNLLIRGVITHIAFKAVKTNNHNQSE